MKMLWRAFFLLIINIVIGAITTVLILGEDVLWKLDFIDTLYSNIGTTPGALFITVFVTEFVLIWGVGMLWITGFFHHLSKTLSRM